MGEVAVPDAVHELGSRTVLSLGGMIAHATANFSEIHSTLDLLLYYLGVSYSLETVTHPCFLDGRVGRICSQAGAIGVIGELHPEVLEHWQVTMPTVAFELTIDSLTGRKMTERPCHSTVGRMTGCRRSLQPVPSASPSPSAFESRSDP